jgi:hypothetical protein
LGDNFRCCGVEAFGWLLAELQAAGKDKELLFCPRWHAAALAPVEDLLTQELIGEGATDLGAWQSLGSGEAHRSCSQEWARAIYSGRPAGDVAGVSYTAFRGGGHALAIWDRAPVLEVVSDALVQDKPVWDTFFPAMASLDISVSKIAVENCAICLTNGVIGRADYVQLA